MSETENTDSEELQFIYKKELWFCNLLINSTKIDISGIVKDLEKYLKNKLSSLNKNDIPNCAWSTTLQNRVIEISKHIDMQISWNPVLKDFPYKQDKITYNNAGFLEFDVEYFKGDLDKKRTIKPWILHEVPVFVHDQLKEFFSPFEYVKVDNDPMYIVAIVDRTEERGLRVEVPWTKTEIQRHKKCISQWVSLYSGRWDDFRESYLDQTIENNIAFRKSELHYIRDESAFFYISESDFKEYFERYYKKRIIGIIGEIRAFQNAIIIVNQSMDELKTNINTAAYFKIEFVTDTLSQLEYLTGVVDSKISVIKNDLESNRYRYYKKVLLHVFETMDIDLLAEQLQSKINQISSSLQNRYQKIQQDGQEQLEKSTFYLNVFFGLGLLADIVTLAVTFFSTLFGEGTPESNTTVLSISGIIGTVCLILIFNYGVKLIRLNRKDAGKKPMQTVDAVILDNKDRIILIKRKFEPFKGAYALPGGFKELAEDKEEALLRETREETGVDLQFGEWQFVDVFDKKDRDPRGPVHTYAYLCKIDDIEERTKEFNEKDNLVILKLDELKKIQLAFDHRDIITKALKFR